MENNSSTFAEKAKPWTLLVTVIAIAIALSVIFVLHGVLGNGKNDIFGLELSFIVCLCFPLILLIISIYYLIKQFNRIIRFQAGKWGFSSIINAPKNLYIKFIGSLMGICFSLGWVLNIMAFWQDDDGNIAKVMVHGAIAAFELFFLDINEDIFQEMEAHGTLLTKHGEHLVEGGIIVVSVLSTICMFSLLVNLFLTRFSAWIHSCFVKVKADKNNQLYIFFGIGDKEQMLAKSIKEAYETDKDPNYMIIFVDTRSGDEEKHNNWESIVSYLTSYNPIVPLINKDRHCFYIVSEAGFDKADSHNFWGSMGLSKIQKRIRQLAIISSGNSSVSPELHFFFLSDDRNQNIYDTRVLSEYLLKEEDIKDIKKVIYCQTRRSSVMSIIEDAKSKPDINLEVQIIDESVLAVERLKENEIFHPSHYVEFEVENPSKVGFAKTPFTSLIVGFGETGRDALRFLYEYGAFVDADKEDYERSPFTCHIIDMKEESKFHHFIAANPAIKNFSSVNHPDESKPINFYQSSDISLEFFSLLERIASDLNYVVVSTGDEEQNISIAINILKYIRTKRKNLNNLIILVRAYENNTLSHTNIITEHYNKILKGDGAKTNIIHIFGSVEDIFKHSTIIKSQFKREGKDYYDTYSKAYKRTNEGAKYPLQTWQERKQEALSKESLEKIDDLHRKESQDYSNAWHALTKRSIMEQVLTHNYDCTLEPNILKVLAKNMFQNENNLPIRHLHKDSVTYPVLDKLYEDSKLKGVSTLITNMAITEHLRWIAAHEMLGYSYREDIEQYYINNKEAKKDNIKDHIRKHHCCLVKWEKLPLMPEKSERLYDYLVVETTLQLMLKESKQPNA